MARLMTHGKAVPQWSWTDICARRIDRHGLAQPVAAERLAEQVGIICGAHAQVMSAAELSVGLRVENVTRADVRRALWTDHTLIKTYGPRGTVHLLRAHDLAMWTGALSAIPPVRSAQSMNLYLTPDQREQIIDAIGIALADAELTIDELTEALVDIAGSWAGDKVMEAFQDRWPRWRDATDTAANRGVLCFGPNRGQKVTYTSPRRWLPDFQPQDGPTALAGVVRRYLYAYGPAAPAQLARWLSAPPRWAADLFATLASENAIQPVDVEGSEAWIVAGDTELPDEPPRGVRLLPYFDAYGVGSHPRDRVFPGRAAERALAGGQAGNFPVLLIDGVVAGLWHQRRSGRKLAITVEPFGKLTAKQRRELDEQVERIGIIQEATPHMTLGEVAIGPHA